jgi:hypothetical protein
MAQDTSLVQILRQVKPHSGIGQITPFLLHAPADASNRR